MYDSLYKCFKNNALINRLFQSKSMKTEIYEHIPGISGVNYIIKVGPDDIEQLKSGIILDGSVKLYNQSWKVGLGLDTEAFNPYSQDVVEGAILKKTGENIFITESDFETLIKENKINKCFDFDKFRNLDIKLEE